jgi:hypothetical protein
MATDVKFLNIADGMEGAHTDINADRDFRRCLEGDMKLGALFHHVVPAGTAGFLDIRPKRQLCFAHGVSGMPYPTGTAKQIGNFGGLITQKLSTNVVDGDTPDQLSYWLDADELLTTLATGDATNPRIDLIELQLGVTDVTETRDISDASGFITSTAGIVTRKRITVTKNVVQGTPGAAPALPATTTGYMPWAYVWVPANHNAVFDQLMVSDVRFPLGYARAALHASNGWIVTAGDWDVTTVPTASFGARRAVGAGESVIFLCPSIDAAVRVQKVHAHASANVNIEIGWADLNTPGLGNSLGVFNDTLAVTPPLPGGSVVPSATKPMAWWASGKGCGGASLTWGTQAVTGLFARIESRAGTTDLYGVSFELAGTV